MKKKPKNLIFKKDICTKLRKNIKPVDLSLNGYGFTYYKARYLIDSLDITVYYQRYVRNPFKIDFIRIYHSKSFKLLSKKELIKLNNLL